MSKQLDLFSIYSSIKVPLNKKEINFEAVSALDGIYVGKNSFNLPVIFFKSSIFNFIGMPNEKFNNIKISRGINYNLSILNKNISGPFFSFELTSLNSNLLKSFFTLVSDFVLFYLENPNDFKIRGYIESIEDLFVDVVEILDDEVVGLFGELLLIYNSKSMNSILDFWHLPLNARFDFSSGYEKIEVKTTSSLIREHYISLEQVQNDNCNVLILSIMVKRTHHNEVNSKSINDLIKEIRTQLDSEKLSKFDEIIDQVTKNLDVSFKFRDYKFDLDYSINSMMFFDTNVLPKIDIKSLPEGVSNVKFKETLDEKYSVVVCDLKFEKGKLYSLIR